MSELQGKVAVVTGGSRGIGEAICIALADAGAAVVVGYNEQQDAALQVAERCREAGVQADVLRLPVTDRTAIRAGFAKVEAEFDGIDILINNAGINKPTDFDEIEDADWDEILDVNLKGPFICSQEVLPMMRKRDGGSIVMIGSVSGQYGGPRTAHYAASKAALISLGQVVARFGAPDGIRCNTIAAGLIASEMAAGGMQSPPYSKLQRPLS